MSQARVLRNFSNTIFKAYQAISPYLRLAMKKIISVWRFLQSVYVYFDESKNTNKNTTEHIFLQLSAKRNSLWIQNITLMRRLKNGGDHEFLSFNGFSCTICMVKSGKIYVQKYFYTIFYLYFCQSKHPPLLKLLDKKILIHWQPRIR